MWTLTSYAVLADGCFDPLHIGHIRCLRVAAALGEVVVNVAPDEAIRAKGREPFQSAEERVATLYGVVGVSAACSYGLTTAIHTFKPKYLVKGVDWVGRLPESVLKACAEHHTTIIYTDTRERSSTERLHG